MFSSLNPSFFLVFHFSFFFPLFTLYFHYFSIEDVENEEKCGKIKEKSPFHDDFRRLFFIFSSFFTFFKKNKK